MSGRVRRVRSKTAPLLVTLETGGWEKDRESWKVIRLHGKKYVSMPVWIHCPIAHLLREPDVRIIRNMPNLRLSLLVKALAHETVHHVIADVEEKDTLDDLLYSLPYGHWLRRELGS
jgi:hypothetical protein